MPRLARLVGMSDLGELTHQAVKQLEPHHHGVVVAALDGDATEIQGTAGHDAGARFEIGSVSKVFTAIVLARLVDAGQVRLDQPLRDFLPAPEGITLRHLAQHTSGLPRLPKGMMLRALLRPNTPDPYRHCTADFLIANLARISPAPPGRRFRYSNLGAGLLGLALSRHTGLTYPELVNREIHFLRGTDTAGPTVQGHDARRRPVAPWHLADLAGAGGLRSTVTDVAAFVRAHFDDGPLTPAVRLALAAEHRMNPFMTVRLGWMRTAQGQIFHNGQTGGFYSFAGFDPEKRTGVVILSDTVRSTDRIAMELLKNLSSRA
ncbi:hypothetical protein GCM10025331_22390 [Actinoplanes utahensis]|nr:serine hydrolase [Actinoplanes utahensis]